MKQRLRIYYTETQKALMWERWHKGDSLQQIAQLFDRNHSSVRSLLTESGGPQHAENLFFFMTSSLQGSHPLKFYVFRKVWGSPL